ncbi:MAG: hypothetical protein R3246_14250 [Acidimicrobiia bacterium]|nr:hypothetical protein [Acidimicrobiia bacterium]
MRRSIILPWTLLALALTACTAVEDASGSTIGGSLVLEDPAAGESVFYDTRIAQPLIDSRSLSAKSLAAFTPTPTPATVVAGSVEPIGAFDPIRTSDLAGIAPLRVGIWAAIEQDGTQVDCFGYYNGDFSSGSRCVDAADATDPAPEIYWELSCQSGRRDRWIAFTIADDVVALRFDLLNDVSVVGSDPAGTGLVAVEGIGTVTRALAQTMSGDIFELDITGSDCPVR